MHKQFIESDMVGGKESAREKQTSITTTMTSIAANNFEKKDAMGLLYIYIFKCLYYFGNTINYQK